MIAFLCRFISPSSNTNKYEYAVLDNTEGVKAQAATPVQSHHGSSNEQATVLHDVILNRLDVADKPLRSSAPVHTLDDQLSSEWRPISGEESLPSGLIVADDPAPDDAVSPLEAFINDLADTENGGRDSAEPSLRTDRLQMTDTVPQNGTGADALGGGMLCSSSLPLHEDATSAPLKSADSIPVIDFPGRTQAIDSPAFMDILSADSCTSSTVASALHSPSSVPLPASYAGTCSAETKKAPL